MRYVEYAKVEENGYVASFELVEMKVMLNAIGEK